MHWICLTSGAVFLNKDMIDVLLCIEVCALWWVWLNLIMISKTLLVMAQLVEPHLDSIIFFFFAGDGLGFDCYSVGGVGGFIKNHTEWIIYSVPWLIWGTAQLFQFKCREKQENCRIF